MKKNFLGIFLGAIGAVLLSIIAAAIYDAIKGNDVFASLARFFGSFFKLMAKKVQGTEIPIWPVLLLVLILIIAVLMITQKTSKKGKRRLVRTQTTVSRMRKTQVKH